MDSSTSWGHDGIRECEAPPGRWRHRGPSLEPAPALATSGRCSYNLSGRLGPGSRAVRGRRRPPLIIVTSNVESLMFVPQLRAIQERCGYLPPEEIQDLSARL